MKDRATIWGLGRRCDVVVQGGLNLEEAFQFDEFTIR